MLTLTTAPNAISVAYQGKIILSHAIDTPAIFIGKGHETMEMYRGNFAIEDYLETRIALAHFAIRVDNSTHFEFDTALSQAQSKTISSLEIALFANSLAQQENKPSLVLSLLTPKAGQVVMSLKSQETEINRLWFRAYAEATDPVWGCGEQMSYFNLRGRHFPLWTSEPGVGRDKSTYITWRSDVENKAGGDYYNTNYPQPTFVSIDESVNQAYALHANTTAYADFDFRHAEFHELQFWAIPESLVWFIQPQLTQVVEHLSTFFGRQPKLPDWIIGGAILGLKKGEAHAKTRLDDALKQGVKVSGIWCEDWSGIRETSFGVRLFWDWQWNKARYPDLKNWIKELNAKDIQFLAYTNPYLCIDGPLYKEAFDLGYMATKPDGSEYAVDFGEFYCGVVDFTLPEAQNWFSERIIQKEMLDLGINGWMADFGEYLPIDLKLADNSCPKLRHNEWPVLWGKVNADALAAKNKTGDAVFFMRAGYSGVQQHCPLLWGGDQSVDFSRHDGLVTVIPAALSSGLLGNAYHHSDIGGYTSLFGNVRSPELFMRWAEMSVFTPVMRTHEGNRPTENLQFWEDATVYAHFAKMTHWHVALVPYVKSLIEQAHTLGLPLQRPLVLQYQDDASTYDIFDQYLYGPDLLIAPIYEAEQTNRQVYLPKGETWIHIWSNEAYDGGQSITLQAPIGQPAVLIRASQKNNPLLSDFLAAINA